MSKMNKVDVALLFKMWNDPANDRFAISKALGIGVSRLYLLKAKYGLPDRPSTHSGPVTDPTPEEIAERARECREKHYAMRRAEPYEAA